MHWVKERTSLLVTVCLGIGIGGCIGPDGAVLDQDGNVLVASPEEVAEAQRTILAIQSESDMPASMDGGVLFDGDVDRITPGPRGSHMVTLKIEKPISGPFRRGDDVTVQTPSLERGGVPFMKGQRFRVFAVEIDGQLRTWTSAGTVALSD